MKKIFAENVIIGSGAGGSTVFHHLSSLAQDCLMIEEGKPMGPSDLTESAPTVFSKSYRYGGVQPVLGTAPFAFGEGKVLGGTTELNGGLLWRTPDAIVEQWRLRGLFSDVDENMLNNTFAEIENLLAVGPVPSLPRADIPSVLLEGGAARNGRQSVEVPRAGGHLCRRSNRCAIGCPIGAKQSMSLTLIPQGRALGGRVLSGHRVHKLVSSGGRIRGAIVMDTETKERSQIVGKNFFLSAGPVQSPLLISKSGGPLHFPIHFHLNAKVMVRFEKEVNAPYSTIFTKQVQNYLNDGIIYMATALSNEFVGLEFASYPDNVVSDMIQNRNNLALYTLQVRTSQGGSLVRVGDHPLLHMSLSGSDADRIKKGLLSLSEDLFGSGAREIWLPVRPRKSSKNLKEVSNFLSVTSSRDFDLTSVHAMASLPLSQSSSALFGLDGRSRHFRNLWSMDAASLPTSIGESPQGSIMALTKLNLLRHF